MFFFREDRRTGGTTRKATAVLELDCLLLTNSRPTAQQPAGLFLYADSARPALGTLLSHAQYKPLTTAGVVVVKADKTKFLCQVFDDRARVNL